MRRLTSLRTLALGLAVSLLATPSLLHAQRTRDNDRIAPEVRKLSFEGVERIDLNDLSKSVSTRATKCRSLVIQVFCMFSNSPTFEDKFYLDRDELRRDVLRVRLYYWKRGYRETAVDTVVERTAPRQVNVTFKVNEGRPTLVRKLAIVYDSTLISDKVRDRLTMLHANDPLDLIMLDSMRVLFQNQLWEEGFGDAAADTNVVVDTNTHFADVSLNLTSNRRTTIGTIAVAGTQQVDPATVRNSITFKTGDLYRQSSVLESQRNLYESNLFRLASIYVPFQPDTVKNVTIDVTEAPLHEARVGPGLNNIDFFQVESHYTAYNMLGGARRLDLDATVGNLLARTLQGKGFFRDIAADVPDENVAPFLQPTYNASVDFKQPAFLQRPADAFGVGAFAHRNINPGVFVDRGFGGQLTFTHQVRVRAPASVNYRYETNRVEASDPYFCVNYGVCDTLTIAALRTHQSLSPVTFSAFIDRSDIPFSPTKGYVARLEIEHASAFTVSDYRYNRIFLDAAAYGHRSGTAKVYSAHLRLGFVRALSTGPDAGVLHPRKAFYAGGANSVRGFAENQLGPRVLTIDDSTLVANAASIGGGTCGLTLETVKFCDPNTAALKNNDFHPQPLGGTSILEGSVEYRFPLSLGPNLRHFVGAVFVDGGILGSGSIQGLQTISNIVKGTGAITPGIGVRYDSPVGPIRVDLAINPNRAENLGVVTTVRDETGKLRLVPLAVSRHFVQGRTLLDRLTLHFSIGEAY